MKTISEIYEQLDNWGFEDSGYFVESGDLEFLLSSGCELNTFKLDWLDKQGFKLQGVWVSASNKCVISMTAKRTRFHLEKRSGIEGRYL